MKLKDLRFHHYLILATVVIVYLAIYMCWKSPFMRALRDGERINGLIMGTDLVDYAKHSDTLIFVSYSPKKQVLDIMSIPRDTHFSPKGYHFRKINEVFTWHYRKTRNEKIASGEVRKAVEELFDNKIVIPYYVMIDYESFRKIINLTGGVDVQVDEAMNYDDKAGNLHIHFEPGLNHMDGQKALEYVRFRGPAGDIGRVYRQQSFIRAVTKKFKNPLILFKLPETIRILSTEVQTNLSFWDLFSAALELKDIKQKDIITSRLPGTPRRDVWEMDRENSFNFLDMITVTTQTANTQGTKIKVEIWNASGAPGLAEELTWILRDKGYDVLDWGNYSVKQSRTIIKDLKRDTDAANKIFEALTCGEIVTRYNSKKIADVEIILGQDCTKIFKKSNKLK